MKIYTRDGPLTVLLIEDNPGDARLIREMLRESRRQVFTLMVAERLQAGLDILADNMLDAILLDLSLPDSTGIATLSRMRNAAPHVPIVVLTGSDDVGLGVESVSEGAQDYLAKDWVNAALLERALIYAIERHQVEQQRLQIAIEQQRIRMLANFINDISHEIRTPLSVIQLASERIEKLLGDDQRVMPRTQQIKSQTAYISSLVDDMLSLTDLDSRMGLELSEVNINHLVRTAAGAIREDADEKLLTLLLELEDDLPLVQAHPLQLHTALFNLLENAVHFTPTGGAINVITSVVGGKVSIAVRDTGSGISEDDLPLIFDRFFRSDQARTGRRAGLGLSIASRIIELHNGKLEAQSKVGRGSMFRVLLPVGGDS